MLGSSDLTQLAADLMLETLLKKFLTFLAATVADISVRWFTFWDVCLFVEWLALHRDASLVCHFFLLLLPLCVCELEHGPQLLLFRHCFVHVHGLDRPDGGGRSCGLSTDRRLSRDIAGRTTFAWR